MFEKKYISYKNFSRIPRLNSQDKIPILKILQNYLYQKYETFFFYLLLLFYYYYSIIITIIISINLLLI